MITIAEFVIFTITVCVHVGFIAVLFAWENSRTIRTLRTVSVLFLLWIVGEFIAAQVHDVSVRLWVQRATGAVGLCTSLAFTRFAYALRYKTYDRYFLTFAVLVSAAAVVYLTTGMGIRSVENQSAMHLVNFGPLFWGILSISIINWVFNVWVMHRAIKELPGYESARKMSITLIQMATTVLSVLGIAGFFLSTAFWEKPMFFRYVPLLSTVFIPFFGVVFYRYGFLTTGIERLARDLFQNALDGIIITDESNIVRQINPRALQLLNVQREVAEGIPLKELLCLPDDIRYGKRFSLVPGDIPGLRYYLSVSVSEVTSHVGIRQNMVILVDMTDEKNAEEAASKSRDELEQEILLRT
ncbi:MAG: PAS domain-containing protein, partial [Deltaproteobacteria bacterium]|nr:PAS domain-containing protein [Deltaproteobacteria bacterium]